MASVFLTFGNKLAAIGRIVMAGTGASPRRDSSLLLLLVLLAASSSWFRTNISEADSVDLPPELEQVAEDIDRTIMSPFCPGRTLEACPSGEARELRGQIRTWLREGDDRDAIESKLEETYGAEVFGAPAAEGIGLWVWIAPGLLVLVGGVSISWWLRCRSAHDQSSKTGNSVGAEGSNGQYLKQIEDEVRRRIVDG